MRKKIIIKFIYYSAFFFLVQLCVSYFHFEKIENIVSKLMFSMIASLIIMVVNYFFFKKKKLIMKLLNECQTKLVSGAVSVRDAASAAGTIIGGIAGSATRIPKGELIGGAVGGFVGGYIYDN